MKTEFLIEGRRRGNGKLLLNIVLSKKAARYLRRQSGNMVAGMMAALPVNITQAEIERMSELPKEPARKEKHGKETPKRKRKRARTSAGKK